VPVLPDEARIAMRLEAKADTVLIEGIPGNFDLVIFDGPTIGRMSRLNAISASAEAVILVAPPDATAAELDRAISLLDLSSSCAVVAVTAADLSEPGRASVAA
jgi:septum formation inhibitor-activating ATPase MinD